jgi:hypothetical protein
LIIDDGSENLRRAGTFFCVQAKSNTVPLIFKKKHELEWIEGSGEPLLICVADRDNGAMDVYYTWNLFHAIHDNWNLSPGCLFQEEIENILPTRKRLSLHEILQFGLSRCSNEPDLPGFLEFNRELLESDACIQPEMLDL